MFSIKKLFRIIGKVNINQPAVVGPVDIYGRPIENAVEYFYPQPVKGIPVFDVHSICEHYNSHIVDIRKHSGISDHKKTEHGETLIDELFDEVIKRFVAFAHMLPASDSHHHSDPGGLVVHSLESSLNAMRFAKERKPRSTGMVDIDKELQPKYHYAVFIGGLLHDTGKLLRDVSVDVHTIFDSNSKENKKPREPIASWNPYKHSLIEWALENRIATYTVTFLKNRVHNRHNVDSASLLTTIVGKGSALDYLNHPTINLMSEISRVLTTGESNKEYLASCVRYGDTVSTSKDMSIFRTLHLGDKEISTSQRIFRAMKLAKHDWEINKPNKQIWVIGGSVYLRWTIAIESIIKVANQEGYSLPTDARTVALIMEQNGMTENIGENQKTISFTPGVFSEKELQKIANSEKEVAWEKLIKLKWNGLLYGTDPVPDSAPGVIYYEFENRYFEVDANGTTIEIFSKTGEKQSAPANELNEENTAEQVTTESTGQKQIKPKRQSKAKTKSNGSDKQEAEHLITQTETPVETEEEKSTSVDEPEFSSEAQNSSEGKSDSKIIQPPIDVAGKKSGKNNLISFKNVKQIEPVATNEKPTAENDSKETQMKLPLEADKSTLDAKQDLSELVSPATNEAATIIDDTIERLATAETILFNNKTYIELSELKRLFEESPKESAQRLLGMGLLTPTKGNLFSLIKNKTVVQLTREIIIEKVTGSEDTNKDSQLAEDVTEHAIQNKPEYETTQDLDAVMSFVREEHKNTLSGLFASLFDKSQFEFYSISEQKVIIDCKALKSKSEELFGQIFNSSSMRKIGRQEGAEYDPQNSILIVEINSLSQIEVIYTHE